MSENTRGKRPYSELSREEKDRKNARQRVLRKEKRQADLNLPDEALSDQKRKTNATRRASFLKKKQTDSHLIPIHIEEDTIPFIHVDQDTQPGNQYNQFMTQQQAHHLAPTTAPETICQMNEFQDQECMLYDVSIAYTDLTPLHKPLLHCPTPPNEAYMLPTMQACIYCTALRFPRESAHFCCSKGETTLYPTVIPAELYELYTGHTPASTHFRQYIRPYNNAFSFTSFRANLDPQYAQRVNGIYTFRAQGQIYHYMNSLLPSDRQPAFLQLYFYDTEAEVSNRKAAASNLDDGVINQLIYALKENPYSTFFRRLKDILPFDNCEIKLKANPKMQNPTGTPPLTSQVGVIWYQNADAAETTEREIIVHKHDGHSQRIHYYYGCYDSLQYPLLFPQGEPGWHQGIKKNKSPHHPSFSTAAQSAPTPLGLTLNELLTNEEAGTALNTESNHMVSAREFYAYRLQIRPSTNSILLQSGRLLQQFVVDMYVKIETSRLDYFRNNQDEIRADLYQGIVDSIKQGETKGSNVGKRIVLPGSFTGGPRDMRRRFLNAMTLVEKYGKPDIFLTMTCNPNWPEIQQELMPFEEAQNRPDLTSRVFKSKFEELRHDLIKEELFGPVVAYTYVVEFQKRGLPHIHMLLILKSSHKLSTPDQFDAMISAELPDPKEHPHLHKMVINHMMHGPCGILNMNKQCMQKGECKNNYPKSYCAQTTVSDDGYPIYRRRETNNQVHIRGHNLDNRWVVPHNPYLLAKFNCHINVEVCSTIKAVKYLYKYIYKGHDTIIYRLATATNNEDTDEIEQFQTARWISPPEATWRIYRFPLYDMHPPVITLQLHLEGQQTVNFKGNTDLRTIAESSHHSKTMLTEFFWMNANDNNAKEANLKYKNFPEKFVWNPRNKKWTSRKRGEVVGRIISINPNQGEIYYLRLLLNYIHAPKSYTHLRTVNQELCDSYRHAAIMHGLLEDDTTHKQCMQEACLHQMPNSLRQYFCIILVHCSPSNPKDFFLQFEEEMSEDYVGIQHLSKDKARQELLKAIDSRLQSMSKSLWDYQLGHLLTIEAQTKDLCKEIQDELDITVSENDLASINLLNPEQKHAYDQILQAVFTKESKSFFIDGPGGTGKTFLYRAILATIRSQGKIAIATASSGVAASILPNGRTAHSRFKIPIDDEGKTTCNVTNQSGIGKLLKEATIIIWDEAPMARKQIIEALDSSLKDLLKSTLPFGGKVVVFGGDFRQVLPVIPKGSKEDCINASLIRSYIWPTLTKLQLQENMRAKHDPAFSEYILRIGNGSEPKTSNDKINIPLCLLINTTTSSLDKLVEFVFPSSTIQADDPLLISQSAILTPKNDAVDDINNTIIAKFPGKEQKYLSFNEAADKSQQGMYIDLLNSISAPGIPAHELILKTGCPILLLRNLDPAKGLCNGTRLICKAFHRHTICAEIAVGDKKGSTVFIPRIPMKPNNMYQYPVRFSRRQFPIRLCFAMTINKAQGQTLNTVGIYLPNPVFSHGQLYVAMSRATTGSKIKILIRPTEKEPFSAFCTDNIVYTELLTEAAIT